MINKRNKEIKRLYKNRYSMAYIGKKYGMSRQRIWQIVKGYDTHKVIDRGVDN